MTVSRSQHPPRFSARGLTTGVLRWVRAVLALAALIVLVAGLPWALAHYVGWPLPRHIPSLAEVQTVLVAPMATPMLLNILACITWMAWFVFTIDVARAAVDAARGITLPRLRPTPQGVAAALVGTIVLALLGNRTTPPPTSVTMLTEARPSTVATAPRTPTPAVTRQADTPATDGDITVTNLPAPPGMVTVRVTVQPPRDGIYDSLWRIAQRLWGDGNRWPELFAGNRGILQPDGRALTVPGYIRPGWQLTTTVPTPPDSVHSRLKGPVSQPTPPQAPPTPSTSKPAPQTPSAPPTVPHRPASPAQQESPARPSAGLTLPTGAFVGVGLAAAISAALAASAVWRRRRYRIGSGDRSDVGQPMAPVVRALHLAHQHTPDVGDGAASDFDDTDPWDANPAGDLPRRESLQPSSTATPAGIHDGRGVALDLAATHGLGLLGPGATAAARALLLSLLTGQSETRGVRVLIPTADVPRLLDHHQLDQYPAGLTLMPDLDTALGELETELLSRTRRVLGDDEADTTPEHDTTVVLLASPTHAQRRLQAILDNGASLGLLGILVGQWRPGTTLRVRTDGLVSATHPDLGEQLVGSRLFSLPASDTTDLLNLLREAQGPGEHAQPTTEQPTTGIAPRPSTAYEPSVSTEDGMVLEITQMESMNSSEGTGNPDSPPVRTLRALADQPVTPQPQTSTPPEPQATGTPGEPPACTPEADRYSQTCPPVAAQADRTTSPEEPDRPQRAIAEPPLSLTVFGQVALTLTVDDEPRDITSALPPRQREILVYLAVHRDGARRDALVDTLWPNNSPERPYNSFYTQLSQLRRNLTKATDGYLTDITPNDNGRYRLDPRLVTVDYWRFHDALTAGHRATTDTERHDALHHAAELHQGELAEDLAEPWLLPPRETAHRDVLDALSVLIRATVEHDPERALSLLERARALDCYNEGVYRNIIRTQARLGQQESIPRTLALLTTVLAEHDQQPSVETTNLAAFLQRRSHPNPSARPGNAAAS